jgi:hypothetical protein
MKKNLFILLAVLLVVGVLLFGQKQSEPSSLAARLQELEQRVESLTQRLEQVEGSLVYLPAAAPLLRGSSNLPRGSNHGGWINGSEYYFVPVQPLQRGSKDGFGSRTPEAVVEGTLLKRK